jgi:hypothetical protein
MYGDDFDGFNLYAWFAGSMADQNDNRFVHHPKDHGGTSPFPPALPTALCHCGLLLTVVIVHFKPSTKHE